LSIAVIQTGGTIDKDYPVGAGAYSFEIAEPAVLRILAKAGSTARIEVVSFSKKDSQEITEIDRQRLVRLCQGRPERELIVTHGTDTMLKTAEALTRVSDKVIVLTGAMRPERFADSDAMFNVGLAVGAVNALPFGVYIAMNGCVMLASRCRRDPESGAFLEVVESESKSGHYGEASEKGQRTRREATGSSL
jgi:L-asparaginase